jgi:hypothetical protein
MLMSYVLDSLTTTHGEVGLPTSTAQRGGLHKVGAREGSIELGFGDLSDQACSRRQEDFTLVEDGVLRSYDP